MRDNMKLYGVLSKATGGILLVILLIFLIGCHQRNSNTQAKNAAVKPPLERLLKGNERFSLLKPIHPDETIEKLRDAVKGQHPFSVIVCCSDSRISPELIFDEGIGDLFVIRTAGNIMGAVEIGSVEYAVEHLGVKLIVVMGHENCGAIKAVVEGDELSGHIKDIVDSIKQEAEIKAIPISDTNRLEDCIKANVLHGIKQLQTQSLILRKKMEGKKLQIIAARYDLDDLKVSIFNE